jgi:hypothetical protein
MEKDSKKRLTHEEIKAKVIEGMTRARKKLIEQERKDDSYLVIFEHGQIVKVKAKDMEL